MNLYEKENISAFILYFTSHNKIFSCGKALLTRPSNINVNE